jgi:hypothetical protein
VVTGPVSEEIALAGADVRLTRALAALGAAYVPAVREPELVRRDNQLVLRRTVVLREIAVGDDEVFASMAAHFTGVGRVTSQPPVLSMNDHEGYHLTLRHGTDGELILTAESPPTLAAWRWRTGLVVGLFPQLVIAALATWNWFAAGDDRVGQAATGFFAVPDLFITPVCLVVALLLRFPKHTRHFAAGMLWGTGTALPLIAVLCGIGAWWA